MNSRPARAQVPGQKPRLSDHLKVQFVNFFLAGRLLARSRYFLFFPGTTSPLPAPLQITVFSSRPVNDPTTLEFCLINVYPPSCFPAENQFLLSPPFYSLLFRSSTCSSTSFSRAEFLSNCALRPCDPLSMVGKRDRKKWSVDD